MRHPSAQHLSVARMALAMWLLSATHSAFAEREHTVHRGQTLGKIAAHYGVSVASLAGANGYADQRKATLRPGQVLLVPDRDVLYVTGGQSLASLARTYHVSAVEFARVNHVREDTALRVGQKLLLPGHEAAVAAQAAQKRWGTPKRPGTVTLYREWSREQQRIRLVDARGRVPAATLRSLEHLLRPRGSRRGKEPHPRLVRLLAQVSDHFGGRPIHVISGNRRPGGYTKETSRHVAAQAIDFQIPGVPLETLRDFCAGLDHVGVGFYPRTKFVHLDVRRTSARWTDRSGPGEAPLLDHPKHAPQARGEEAEGEPDADDDGQAPIDEAPP